MGIIVAGLRGSSLRFPPFCFNNKAWGPQATLLTNGERYFKKSKYRMD